MSFRFSVREHHRRQISRIGRTIALAAIALAPTCAPLCALEPTTPLARYSRQSWTMENGLPQNTVSVLLQSRDGFLWAGTELGLARFDGTSFRTLDHAATPSFPDAEVRTLLDTPSGLWIGTSDGIVLWRSGRATLFTTSEGLPANSIHGIVQTPNGTLWVCTDSGLAQFDGTRFQPAPASPRSGTITSIATDSANNLWTGSSAGIALLRNGQWQSLPQLPSGPGIAVNDPAGNVWLATVGGLFLSKAGSLTVIAPRASLPTDGINFVRPLPDGTVAVASKSSLVLIRPGQPANSGVTQFAVGKQLPGTRIESLFSDREGSLWIGTNRGLARISPASNPIQVQQLPQTDPLTANSIVSFLEDREGDLWIGTESGGLHILRDARFRHLGLSDGLSSDSTTAIVQDKAGSIWIGTRDAGLNHVVGGKTTTLSTANGLPSNVILALAAAPNGDIWAGTPDGLGKISGSRIATITSADGLSDDFIRSLLVQADGSLWIGTRRGLTHLDHGKYTTLTTADGLGSNLVGALAQAPNGDLWIATLNGLSSLHAGKLRNYTTADGLSSNVITALEVLPNGALAIGTQDAGLNLWNGQRFNGINSPGMPASIHAILYDNVQHELGGHLWLASGNGLSRIAIPSLLQCAACILPIQQFTTADGLRSRETSSNSHPTALRTVSGELWFTTPRGVVLADPAHFPDQSPNPPVAIERFSVDDTERNPDADNPIPAGARRLQFDYAGLSFASPQKLQYAYMLEGFDHSWTSAGTRRTAYYTNIPPGHYRFLVRASLGDIDPAITSSTEAALAFQLLPHIYQTWWFRTLLILVTAILILLAFRQVYRRRVLRVEREFNAVMGERNRIAREIHDTLAQGYVGISLQLEILGQLLRGNRTEAASKHLALTQDLVREGLDDARESIWALRSQDSGEQTLPIRIERAVSQASGQNLTANFAVHGAYRPLSVETEKEILRVAQEAIQNVKKHSGANHLHVRLDYLEIDARYVTLSVRDDGKGFDPETNAPQGHYGLTGMKERARLIQGEISIASTPGNGTTVTLKVHARNRTRPPGATPPQGQE